MRIAWCTPTANRSAIAGKSEVVVEALRARGIEVDVWFPPGAGGRDRLAGQREMGPGCEAALAAYDATIYCVGDHAPYHGRIVEASEIHPGIVVLHDISLANLYNGMSVERGVTWLRSEVRRTSGVEAEAEVMARFRQRGGWPGDPTSAAAVPMVGAAVRNATAVVTHSRFAAEQVRDGYLGDVHTAWLPTPRAERTVHAGAGGWFGNVRLPIDRPIVLQVGNLNANKRTDAVVAAFAEAGLWRRARLVIAGDGPVEVLQDLRRRIDRLDLRDCVHLLGPVDDRTVHELRSVARVSVVLRDPCLEAASAGALDALAYGMPCVAVDAGMYAELPPETVRLVSAPPQAEDVAAAIRWWLDDGERVAGARHAALGFVDDLCSAERYADVVLEAIAAQGAARTRRLLSDSVTDLLHGLHLLDHPPTVERILARTHELFAARPARLPSTPMPDQDWLDGPVGDAATAAAAVAPSAPAGETGQGTGHAGDSPAAADDAPHPAIDDVLAVSYAQNGEDIVLGRAFTGPTGFYVDIGAYHPDEDSVTKRFYDRGWHGINVDPIPEVIRSFDQVRPRDVNVHAAITTTSGETTFWQGPEGLKGHSTLETDIAMAHATDGQGFAAATVRTMTLAELLDAHVPAGVAVDFLKVDVEGHERAVLASGDWTRWRPRVVVVECMAPHVATSTHGTWEHFLLDAGYTLALFDGLNRFYVAPGSEHLMEPLSSPASVIDEFERVGVRNLRHRVTELETLTDRLTIHLERLQARSTWLERRLRFVGVDADDASGEHP